MLARSQNRLPEVLEYLAEQVRTSKQVLEYLAVRECLPEGYSDTFCRSRPGASSNSRLQPGVSGRGSASLTVQGVRVGADLAWRNGARRPSASRLGVPWRLWAEGALRRNTQAGATSAPVARPTREREKCGCAPCAKRATAEAHPLQKRRRRESRRPAGSRPKDHHECQIYPLARGAKRRPRPPSLRRRGGRRARRDRQPYANRGVRAGAARAVRGGTPRERRHRRRPGAALRGGRRRARVVARRAYVLAARLRTQALAQLPPRTRRIGS
jgi:hypothetical protein